MNRHFFFFFFWQKTLQQSLTEISHKMAFKRRESRVKLIRKSFEFTESKWKNDNKNSSFEIFHFFFYDRFGLQEKIKKKKKHQQMDEVEDVRTWISKKAWNLGRNILSSARSDLWQSFKQGVWGTGGGEIIKKIHLFVKSLRP